MRLPPIQCAQPQNNVKYWQDECKKGINIGAYSVSYFSEGIVGRYRNLYPAYCDVPTIDKYFPIVIL